MDDYKLIKIQTLAASIVTRCEAIYWSRTNTHQLEFLSRLLDDELDAFMDLIEGPSDEENKD